MKTTVVQLCELGDDWRPSAHMVRVLTAAKNLRDGDQIRVREHRKGSDGESRRWHTVKVIGAPDIDRSTVVLNVDKWPIAYVCMTDELVELVEINRRAVFRCVVCHRADSQDKLMLAVTLKDFVDQELVKKGGLQVVILQHTDPEEIVGYCRDHGANFLS